jgi:chromosome segregation ATPase
VLSETRDELERARAEAGCAIASEDERAAELAGLRAALERAESSGDDTTREQTARLTEADAVVAEMRAELERARQQAARASEAEERIAVLEADSVERESELAAAQKLLAGSANDSN